MAIADVSEYQRIFETSLWFEQDEDTLDYDDSACGLPVTFSNPTLHALFEKHAQTMLGMLKKQADISSKVKIVIMNHVRDEHLSLQMAADVLYMSARTLQRKLEREGTSLSGIA